MRWILVGVTLLTLAGCGSKKDVMMPGSRMIYQGGLSLWTFCDRGNRVYMSDKGLNQVIPGGCPGGEP
jgi:hypothetical protein